MRCALGIVLIGVVVAGCVGTEVGGGLRGESGSVAWEVVHLRQTRANDTGHDPTITWWYTLVLRNTSASGITFHQLTSGMVTSGESWGGQGTEPYRTTLKPGDETRLDQTFTFRCRDCDNSRAAQVFSQGIVRVLEFEGQDDQGRPVKTTARIRLDSSSGPLLH